MGGNLTLRRDVLRWIITHNLSQPIKNVKRDFSNGCLVAELFSRYHPQDVHMHSFDYGTRYSKKRDNWDQLEKLFRKVGFPVLPGEVENIINCGPGNEIGPMLERMHSFLTHKRCKQDENNVEDHWTQLPKTSINSPSRDTHVSRTGQAKEQYFQSDSEIVDEDFHYNGISRSLDSISHQSISAFGTSSEDSATRGSHEVKHASSTESSFERLAESDMKSILSLSADDFTVPTNERKDTGYGETIPAGSLYDPCCAIVSQLIHKENSHLNAVERARLKEAKKIKESTKSGSDLKMVQDHYRQASFDPRLAFRSPNRQRDFKSYSLKDYKRQQPGGYVVLGKLGPETTHELELKKKMLVKMKEFGCKARAMVISQDMEPRKSKQKVLSNREKALKFASTIPRPKMKEVAKELQENHHPAGQTLTELEILEAKHQADKKQFEMIRRDLESFLR